MIATDIKITDNTKAVERAVERAAYRSFSHAAASIRKDAIASILKDEDPAPAGDPPHTRLGRLKRAIVYSASKEGAVIGPRFSRFGTAGEAHEKGIFYKGQYFSERAFMRPAMERNLDRFAVAWRGSVS